MASETLTITVNGSNELNVQVGAPDAVNQAPIAVDDSTLEIPFELPEGGSIVSTDANATIVKGEIVAEGPEPVEALDSLPRLALKRVRQVGRPDVDLSEWSPNAHLAFDTGRKGTFCGGRGRL